MAGSNIYFAGGKVLKILQDFDGGSAPIYIGEAEPGTATTDARWRIQKRTYSNRKLTKIEWASSDSNFDKKWSLRTTYIYG